MEMHIVVLVHLFAVYAYMVHINLNYDSLSHILCVGQASLEFLSSISSSLQTKSLLLFNNQC
jgi:hypothetical protein